MFPPVLMAVDVLMRSAAESSRGNAVGGVESVHQEAAEAELLEGVVVIERLEKFVGVGVSDAGDRSSEEVLVAALDVAAGLGRLVGDLEPRAGTAERLAHQVGAVGVEAGQRLQAEVHGFEGFKDRGPHVVAVDVAVGRLSNERV